MATRNILEKKKVSINYDEVPYAVFNSFDLINAAKPPAPPPMTISL